MGYVMTGELTYKLNYDDKTAFVVEVNNVGREVIIPEEVNGCKVISIMKEVFKDNLDVVIVTIPATVEFIGAKAFMNCINLKTVIIKNTEDYENNVTLNMYSAVFANCTNLTNVDLRYPTKFMDWSIFENCVNLENISTDCILGNIPSRTFDGCVKVKLNSGDHIDITMAPCTTKIIRLKQLKKKPFEMLFYLNSMNMVKFRNFLKISHSL